MYFLYELLDFSMNFRQTLVVVFYLFIGATSLPWFNKNIKEVKCGYKSCNPVKDGFINVHIVPHTHDDVGWLKTVDQYYYGSNTATQKAGVQYILDTVVDSLRKSEDRRFIYVETAFFWKWWTQQSESVQEEVKNFVNTGRLEFIGGGWSMNDEAATHYHSIIDQMTWGLRKLNDTFGECGRPKIGWQIDPFGHSKEMANIFAQLGFDAYLIGRIDFQDKNYRWQTQTPEFLWRGSNSLGESNDIFSGILYNTYSPPPGFCFDILCSDEPFIDNKKSFEYNVDKRVDDFLAYATNVSKIYTTNNILITMGEDFHYQDAEVWFKNLDKLIRYTNERQSTGSKFNLLYSTPSCYVKAVYDETKNNSNWLLKKDDFFPYASQNHTYWTGYFTSRPAIKRYERIGNNFLQVCKQLYALADLGSDDNEELSDLREIMGILQHHDAVAGTEKQHVADDYARQLQRAIDECENLANTALNKLINSNSNTTEATFKTCLLANISQCSVTETLENFVVTLYNPLSRSVDKLITLPVTGSNYNIQDKDGNILESDIFPIPDYIKNIPGRESNATHDLYFIGKSIPPLGWKSFIISLNDTKKSSIKLKNSTTSFDIDEDTGLVNKITLNNISIPFGQNFYFYNGFVGDNQHPENRSSGAYVFRPDGEIKKIAERAEVTSYEGSLVFEIRQKFSDYVSQTARVNKVENYIEFDWVIGPIPDTGPNGIEIVTKYSTNLTSNATFYTDSNGKEMLKRIRDFRPTWKLENTEPESGNYYPITSKISIRDEEAGIEVAVLNDRAQGGSSLKDGEIELMIHRSCIHDDDFGVSEALNEKAFDTGLVIRGSHYITAGYLNPEDGKSISSVERDIAQRRLLDTWTFITPLRQSFEDYKTNYVMEYSGINNSLPNNVQILTLEPWKNSSVLLRLEHVFENDEDQALSQPVSISLKNLFVQFEIVSLQETTLGANQWLKDNERLRFNTTGTLEDLLYNDENTDIEYANLINEKWNNKEENVGNVALNDNINDFEVVLNPSDIRTFVLEIKRI